MKLTNPKFLVGKTIERVEMNTFPNGRGGYASAPVIYFTDGSSISFETQETERGYYGTKIDYQKSQVKERIKR
jgi:hypothetical protein